MRTSRKQERRFVDDAQRKTFIEERAKHLHAEISKADRIFLEHLNRIAEIDENKPENQQTILLLARSALLECLKHRLAAHRDYMVESGGFFEDPESPLMNLSDPFCRTRLRLRDVAFFVFKQELDEFCGVCIFGASVMLGRELGNPVGFVFAAPEMFADAIIKNEIEPLHPDSGIPLEKCSSFSIDMGWRIEHNQLYRWACTKWPTEKLKWLKPPRRPTRRSAERADRSPPPVRKSRMAWRVDEIEAALNTKALDIFALPEGTKVEVCRELCERYPDQFSHATFPKAWQQGVRTGRFRMAKHEVFSGKGE